LRGGMVIDNKLMQIEITCRYCSGKTPVQWVSARRSGGFTCQHCDMINMLTAAQFSMGDRQHRGAIQSYFNTV